MEHESAAQLTDAMVTLEDVHHGLELRRVHARDPELEVVLAGQPAAGDHLRDVRETTLEGRSVDALAKPHVAHHDQLSPERRGVQFGTVTPDHAAGPQPADPVGHCVRREPDRLAEVVVGRARILLEEAEQRAVDSVQGNHVDHSSMILGQSQPWSCFPRHGAQYTLKVRTKLGANRGNLHGVETLVLRLVLPPVTVLLAGWVQQRLGPAHSGRLVGLPLTSGPFLVVLLLTEGQATTVTAAWGVVGGQLMVLGFAATYAALSRTHMRPRRVLAAAVLAVALLAAAAHAWLSWPAALVVMPLAAAALFGWRPEAAGRGGGGTTPGNAPAARELAARAALTGGLVAGLSTMAPVLGPSLAGVLAAVPLAIAVVAPATHARAGAASARTLLRGTVTVVPGTAAFAAVVAAAVVSLGAAAAFGLALAVMFTVNRMVGAADRQRYWGGSPWTR